VVLDTGAGIDHAWMVRRGGGESAGVGLLWRGDAASPPWGVKKRPAMRSRSASASASALSLAASVAPSSASKASAAYRDSSVRSTTLSPERAVSESEVDSDAEMRAPALSLLSTAALRDVGIAVAGARPFTITDVMVVASTAVTASATTRGTEGVAAIAAADDKGRRGEAVRFLRPWIARLREARPVLPR
jgi:hypothetical protein